MGSVKKDRFILYFYIIWAVQMAVAFYFCTQKQGFYEDEYYTYYSTARTAGFYVEDGKWMERDDYYNEFVVLDGQQFQYGLVKQVQSWDVHPPVYYWVFHTVASFFPRVFSKWIGLSVNLFFHGINLVLLAYLSYLAGNKEKKLSLAVTCFYGFTPAAISGVVFIRMYELLTTFVFLCAVLHIREMRRLESLREHGAEDGALEKGQRGEAAAGLSVVRFLLPMMAVTYLGFLTQYYYFIFLFYAAIAFCVYLLWRDRNVRNCLRYGLSQGAAFVLAYLTYPSCLGQMFHGQRGAQATDNFFNLSNTFSRFAFFYKLLDEFVFGKMLPVFILFAICLILIEIQFTVDFWFLLFAVAGYFLTVSKTALLLGETSIRYQMPVCGMVVLLIFFVISKLWERCRVSNAKVRAAMAAAAVIFCLALDANGLMADRVAFLYPEDKEQVQFARGQAQAGTPVIYLYQTGEEWCVWDVSNELFEYPEVYFSRADGVDKIKDDRIASASSLVVYLAKGTDTEGQLQRILGSNPALRRYRMEYEEKYCEVYYFYS